MSYLYLASPYSSPEASIREARYREALRASAWLFQHDMLIFSPIVHCHHLAESHAMPSDAEFWKSYDQTMIRFSSGVIILQIEGWRESKGVTAEIAFANQLGVEIIGMSVLLGGGYRLA